MKKFGDASESWQVDSSYSRLWPFLILDVAPFAARSEEVEVGALLAPNAPLVMGHSHHLWPGWPQTKHKLLTKWQRL